ncbi:hypothetical protein ACLOAV_004208 [Pseudogymnoascus australis]
MLSSSSSSSNWHPATVDEDAGSSDLLMEKPDKDAESSDQLMETTDEDAESSDQLAETQSDDGVSSDQISETSDEDLEPTIALPRYSSVQTVADIETGSSYELQGNMMQRLRVIDLESGRSEPTKPGKNWTHKVGRMLTLKNVFCGVGILVGGVVGRVSTNNQDNHD